MTRMGVSKSIVGRVAGSWRGHAGRLPPFGSPVFAKRTHAPWISLARSAGGLSPTNAAMSIRSNTNGMSSPWQAPSIPVPAGVRQESR